MPVDLPTMIEAIEAIAPLELAAAWDNTGLLLEPPTARPIETLFLTIDLTEPVLDEAIAVGADAILAYHPLIFGGVKRLVLRSPHHRIILRCLEAGLPLYAPHTALDAAPGGMNDWLIDGLGPIASRRPIEPAQSDPAAGMGRVGELVEAVPLATLIRRVKAWLDLPNLRVAAPDEHAAGALLRRVAVCPGAGGSAFEALAEPVDLLVTGEMRHHDVLERVAAGTSVILTDHTNTERGFLAVLGQRLGQALPIRCLVSTRDRDPLVIR